MAPEDESNADLETDKAKGSIGALLNGASALSTPTEVDASIPTTEEGASKVIVIHPGSRWLRIGKASDPLPASVHHVLARKRKRHHKANGTIPQASAPLQQDPSLDANIEILRTQFRARMRDYKLRQPPNGQGQASAYNETSAPDIIPELNDPYKIDWTDLAEVQNPNFLIGQEVCRVLLLLFQHTLRIENRPYD